SEFTRYRVLDKGEFDPSVAVKSIDCDDDRQSKLPQIDDMSSEVREAGSERRQVLGAEGVLGHSAVPLEGSDGRDEHRCRRLQSGLAALDVEKFLGAEIRAE